MKFEERWSKQKLGTGVAGWYWDTMLAAHILDNRSDICSIKFQAYIHLGIPDYDSKLIESHFLRSVDGTANGFNRIRELGVNDLLRYNGMDSILEYRIAMKQMAQFPRGV